LRERVWKWCDTKLLGFKHFDVQWERIEEADEDVCKVFCLCCEAIDGKRTPFACGGKQTADNRLGEACPSMKRHLKNKHSYCEGNGWCRCAVREVAVSEAMEEEETMNHEQTRYVSLFKTCT
jgi:hypothetical protein